MLLSNATCIATPWLRKQGYGGVWKCRTSMTANKKDGCGLFYKLDKFDLLAKREIEYNDIAFGRPIGYDPNAPAAVRPPAPAAPETTSGGSSPGGGSGGNSTCKPGLPQGVSLVGRYKLNAVCKLDRSLIAPGFNP